MVFGRHTGKLDIGASSRKKRSDRQERKEEEEGRVEEGRFIL